MDKKVEKICPNCGKISRIARSQRKWDVCCSLDCLREWKTEIGEWGISKKKRCLYCNKPFWTSTFREEKYCSPDCFHKSRRVSDEDKRTRRREYTRKYRAEHPAWTKSCKHRSRATEFKFGGNFTPDQWENLKIKFNFSCAICWKSEPDIELTIDHKIPACKWKEWSEVNKPNYRWNDIENIQPLCNRCNSSKAGHLK